LTSVFLDRNQKIFRLRTVCKYNPVSTLDIGSQQLH
jgi:hypothetical protein